MKKRHGFQLPKVLLFLTALVISICLLVACGGGTETETDLVTGAFTDAASEETADSTSARPPCPVPPSSAWRQEGEASRRQNNVRRQVRQRERSWDMILQEGLADAVTDRLACRIGSFGA